MGGIRQNLPDHDNWGSALWGGAKQATKNVATLGKQIITGEAEMGGHTMKVSRSSSFRMIDDAVSGAFRAHTFSLREPEKFNQLQARLKAFQSGE